MDRNQLTLGEIVFVFGLFIVLPLGILLVRLLLHLNQSFRKAGDFRTFGIIHLIAFILLALLYVYLLSIGNDVSHMFFVICLVVYFFASIYFLWESRKRFSKLNELHAYYRQLTSIEGETSIDVIAQLTKQRPIVVKNDILRMMFIGALEKGFIDEISNQIVFYNRSNSGGHNYANQVTINMTAAAAAEDEEEPVIKKQGKVKAIRLTPMKVECPGCGSASTLQPEETINCPYCGTSMAYPS